MRAFIAAAFLLALWTGAAAADPPGSEADGVPVMTMEGRCAPLAKAIADLRAAGLVPAAQGPTRGDRYRMVIAASPDLSSWSLLMIDDALGLACVMQGGSDLRLRAVPRDEGAPS